MPADVSCGPQAGESWYLEMVAPCELPFRFRVTGRFDPMYERIDSASAGMTWEVDHEIDLSRQVGSVEHPF